MYKLLGTCNGRVRVQIKSQNCGNRTRQLNKPCSFVLLLFLLICLFFVFVFCLFVDVVVVWLFFVF